MTNIEDWLGTTNELGIEIWNKKYRYNNESFDEWLDRVSGGDKQVRDLILDRKFLFGGRILSNRGTGNGTTSNCFVLSMEDSVSSIYDTARDMAITFKEGGGVGVDISKLAPAGAKVNNPAKTSSGAVSFIDLYASTSKLIGQNGRRGALMVSISCDHPDMDKFIELKTDVEKATAANLSIRASDDFMTSVVEDKTWTASFNRPESQQMTIRIKPAKEIFDKICDANYDYGEPGLLFWDMIENYNMLSKYEDFKFAGVNPCGELPLPEGGACLLGSMNLAAYVREDQDKRYFDFLEFSSDVATAIRALDDVRGEGIPYLPLQIQKEVAMNWKQIGLGIMGLADMLIMLNIPYGSNESIEICDQIGNLMAVSAIRESIRLGEERGSFEMFDGEKTYNSPFWEKHMSRLTHRTPPVAMRNSQLLAIAPTGSISTMLGVSGGIEPLYALKYTRTTKSLHDGAVTSYEVEPQVVFEAHRDGLTKGLICAKEIDYRDRIAMQSVWQKHIDGSISSTINIPEDFPRDKVRDIYIGAWKAGCKGVTIFREGCKRDSILTTKPPEPVRKDVIKPEELIGYKRKIIVGCGSEHVCVYVDKEGNPRELFIAKGSTGGCANTLTGLSRMTSLALRNDIPLEEVLDQLESCGSCPSYAIRRATKGDVSVGSCCPSALAKVIREIAEYAKGVKSESKTVSNPCPQCGAELAFTNGCRTCNSCGYSKCS